MHPQKLLFVAACFMYCVAVFTSICFVFRWWSCFPWTVFRIDLNERTKEVSAVRISFSPLFDLQHSIFLVEARKLESTLHHPDMVSKTIVQWKVSLVIGVGWVVFAQVMHDIVVKETPYLRNICDTISNNFRYLVATFSFILCENPTTPSL